MRIVCIYPGRFQPFHTSHYTVYKYLVSKFGANNVYIVTSNKVQAKSPFNFKEKVLIMNRLFGIPTSQILYSTTPYRVESLYSKFNKDNTVLVYASTEKDPRLSPGKYFRGQLPKDPKPYSQQAYTIPVPYMSNKFEGQEISGTTVRNLFSSSMLSSQQKKKAFKLIFGKYDESVFKLFMNKLGGNLNQELLGIKDSKDNRVLLTCGGASGHMTHIFQDTKLTFNDFKTIINNLLSGKIDLESEATMKYDGQNINVSWKNGKLIGARNKGHMKNFGQNAPDILGIKDMFAGRGAVREAFVYAMIDLQRAFSKLSQRQLNQIFGQGKRWLALEIIYPKNTNVIPYNKSMLVFHNITQVDKDGNKVKIDNSMAKTIYSILVQVNANIQKHFSMQPPTVVKLPKISNFAARKSYYMSKLNSLQKKYNLSGNSTLQDYNDAYWREFINSKAAALNYKVPKELMDALITRWSRLDKSASLNKIKSLCDNPEFLNWIRLVDKNDHKKIKKKNAYDWQTLFMELTSEILKNLGNYIAVNPKDAVNKLSSQLLSTAEQIKNSNNLALIDRATQLMNRINALGGIKAIVPTEGIVFTYKGNTYKATGLFPDLNQILGAFRYARYRGSK